MDEHPPSRVRVVSHEGISETEVRIMLEIIVDVNRLAEVGHDFLSQAVTQLGAKQQRDKT